MKNKNFQLYLWSSVISQISSVAAGLAIPIIVYRFTNSLTIAGVFGSVSGLSALAGGIVGGSIADMYNRKLLIGVANTVAGVLNLVLAGLVYYGYFDPLWFGFVLALTMFFAVVGQSCEEPSLPQLVSKHELAKAQGIIQARMQISALLGPVIGGIALDVNMSLPFILVALGNLLTPFFYLFISTPLNPVKRSADSFLRTTAEGIRIVASSSLLRSVITSQLFANCAINGSLFIVVLMLEANGNPGWIVGAARTSIGVIGALGAFAVGYFQKRFSFNEIQIGNHFWIAAMLIIAAAASNSMWAVVPLGLSVIAAPAAGAVMYARLHEIVAEEAFGRVTNLQVTAVGSLSSMWTSPLGSISNRWSLDVGMWVSCAAALLSIPFAFLLIRRNASVL